MTDFSAGLACVTAGWGVWKVNKKPDGKPSYLQPDKLQILISTMMGKSECQRTVIWSKKRLPDSVICTVPNEFKGTCMVIKIRLNYFFLITNVIFWLFLFSQFIKWIAAIARIAAIFPLEEFVPIIVFVLLY